jgi:Undecaprenyl-phosphate glucose phosphotransferase
MMVGLYSFKLGAFSRGQLAIFFCTNLSFMLVERMVVRSMLRKLRRQGYNLRHCLVVGANQISDDFINRVEKNEHWGYCIDGILDNWISSTKDIYHGYTVLGKIHDLEQVLSNHYYDMVIVALTSEDVEELGYVLSQCEKAGVKSSIIPYYYQYVPTQPDIDDLDGLAIIDTRRVPLENWLKAGIKRAFDILFASVAILITSPIMLFAVVMIKLTSPGPIIFHQERIGLNRQPFMMYKFRSMHVQKDEEEKVQWTTKNDPRKTKWGAFMRKTSIDELPQFFNVLKGDMSVIGPRPERPFFVEKFKEEVPRYMIKHQVRPGITGWAQVNGYRGDTSIEERINHDLYYIENWTFAFDMRIIFLTVFKGFINKNAY